MSLMLYHGSCFVFVRSSSVLPRSRKAARCFVDNSNIIRPFFLCSGVERRGEERETETEMMFERSAEFVQKVHNPVC